MNNAVSCCENLCLWYKDATTNSFAIFNNGDLPRPALNVQNYVWYGLLTGTPSKLRWSRTLVYKVYFLNFIKTDSNNSIRPFLEKEPEHLIKSSTELVNLTPFEKDYQWSDWTMVITYHWNVSTLDFRHWYLLRHLNPSKLDSLWASHIKVHLAMCDFSSNHSSPSQTFIAITNLSMATRRRTYLWFHRNKRWLPWRKRWLFTTIDIHRGHCW